MNEKVWRLRRSDAIVADIHVNDGDFPWLRGRFTARAGFADVEADAPVFVSDALVASGTPNAP